MGLGHQGEHQGTLFLAFDEIPRSRGHAFYDRLQQILRQFRFDAFVEKLCQSYYADKGHPSIPPGRYFRMHFVGYFEGIDSERGIGVDASTMEANAALRTIVRRDTDESYRQMLLRMAKGSGIEAPTADDLVRLDRRRKDKSLSNKDWRSPVDPEAKVAKMKDGRTWPTSRNMRWIWTAVR